jgi:hypothetical protein
VVVEVAEIVQSQAEMEPAVVAEDTAALQIGAIATTHTVKIHVEDGALLMPIVPIPDQVVAQAHTGHQTSAGIKVVAMGLPAS